MLAACVIIVAVALFIFSLVLWTRGYRELSQNGAGTRLAFFVILAAFVVGVAGVMFAFRHWRQELLVFGVFVFLVAVGAFQIGIATHGLAVGYIRETGEEERRISGRYFYAYEMFVMPTGREVVRAQGVTPSYIIFRLRRMLQSTSTRYKVTTHQISLAMQIPVSIRGVTAMALRKFPKILFGLVLFTVLSAARAAEITLFEGPNFQGRNMTLRGEADNLDRTGFNDATSSIIVRDGVWEVCVDAFFQGGCTRLRPGEYPQLDQRFNRSISSLRVVEERSGERDRGPERRSDDARPREGRGAQAILFEGPNFSGRSFPIHGDVIANFDGTGFNDRASSLRVEDGYWIFCSDAQFQGDCQTFGPGDYPALPWGLDRKISSGRRIHERYPYNGRPDWNR